MRLTLMALVLALAGCELQLQSRHVVESKPSAETINDKPIDYYECAGKRFSTRKEVGEYCKKISERDKVAYNYRIYSGGEVVQQVGLRSNYAPPECKCCKCKKCGCEQGMNPKFSIGNVTVGEPK